MEEKLLEAVSEIIYFGIKTEEVDTTSKKIYFSIPEKYSSNVLKELSDRYPELNFDESNDKLKFAKKAFMDLEKNMIHLYDPVLTLLEELEEFDFFKTQYLGKIRTGETWTEEMADKACEKFLNELNKEVHKQSEYIKV